MKCSTNEPHVYHSFEKDHIKFILLDVRYYRDRPPRRANRPSSARTKYPTILGKEQEEWLADELNHDKKSR